MLAVKLALLPVFALYTCAQAAGLCDSAAKRAKIKCQLAQPPCALWASQEPLICSSNGCECPGCLLRRARRAPHMQSALHMLLSTHCTPSQAQEHAYYRPCAYLGSL